MDKENLIYAQGEFHTPAFRTVADRVCIRMTGRGAQGDPHAKVYYTTAKGETRSFGIFPAQRSDELSVCAFSFDPVSLSIYQNAIEFFIVFRDFSSVCQFSLDEQTDISDASGTDSIAVSVPPGQKPILRRVLFVGNSILLGMPGGFGMCSSSAEHDYCHHVQQDILSHSPECRFSKLYGSPFEHSASEAEFEAWWAEDPNSHTGRPAKDSFTQDLDLIILQMGDNVNTDQKLSNFLLCAPILLQKIRELCPHARIIWVHEWYNSHLTAAPIRRLCTQWQLEQVDIHGLRCPENQSFSGAQYTAPDGSSATVNDAWITHPGDAGMRLIAWKIVDTLSL